MTAIIVPRPIPKDESDDDKDLQIELKSLVEKIVSSEGGQITNAVEMLKFLIRTSTCSMTSVPKPLKYLASSFTRLKETHSVLSEGSVKKKLADVISVLSLGVIPTDGTVKENDCLKYCLLGTMQNMGDWGHEYIRRLELEIVQQWTTCESSFKTLYPLVREIMQFNCTHHDEIQGCDLLMEINEMNMLIDYITDDNYKGICLYLASCARYVDDLESRKILKLISQIYLAKKEYCRALIVALQTRDDQLITNLFESCKDRVTLYQMAFICARHYPIELKLDDEELGIILENSHLNQYFLTFARELDIMEPKAPEDVYKTWLEPVNFRHTILGEKLDSARQNLASSFVNGFVNAGFGSDKLLTTEDGNRWIYRNKELGMMSATAALGLLYLWDVDGGLTPIDKYLYTTDVNVKAGALLALGIVNSRIRNDCDPALALLGDYLTNPSEELQLGAALGIGLAYAGTGRRDVLSLLLPIVPNAKSIRILGVASLACGLVALGRNNYELCDTILTEMIKSNGLEALKNPFMILAALGVALSYYGTKEDIEVPTTIIEVFEEPFKTFFQTLLQMCAYAGTGDVLIIQELLRIVEEKVPIVETPKNKPEWDQFMGKAIAVLAVAAISKGEEIGVEMSQRIFGQISRYGEPAVRRAVPLAIALSSVSDPQPNVINILTKYSHDTDDDVACNAIFGLGYVGAGTNNARLAMGLRQLALYHTKNPTQLFMVRLAQGLVHLGKGTMTLNPLHTDRQLLDGVAMAGILIPLVSLLKPQSLILGKAHYLMYTLAVAMQPRWLLTLDEDLNSIPVTVRVGQAVDIVGKAGAPKTIAGIHTHTTPILLCANERAELSTEEHVFSAPALDGICVIRKVEL